MVVFLLALCVVGCICSQVRLISAKTFLRTTRFIEPVLVIVVITWCFTSRRFSIKFLCLVLFMSLIGFPIIQMIKINHLEAKLNSSVYFNKNAAVKTNSVSLGSCHSTR